jgi:hypothetical protein
MKTTFKHLFILSLLFFIVYLMHVFIVADFNIENWKETERLSTVLIMIVVIIFYLLIQID